MFVAGMCVVVVVDVVVVLWMVEKVAPIVGMLCTVTCGSIFKP